MRAYPVYFEDLEYHTDQIFFEIRTEDFTHNPYYQSNWFKFLFYYQNGQYAMQPVFDVLYSLYGEREVIIPRKMKKVEYTDDHDYLLKLSKYVGSEIRKLFILNTFKYQKIFDVLMEEYHPLWNVEGSETRTITETQEGYRQNEKKTTGKYSEETKTEYDGQEKVELGGHDDFSKTGKAELTKTGKRAMTKSGDEVHKTVPMENTTFYDTDKTHYENVKDEESFENYKESESYDLYKETTDYGRTDTKSFTNRKDTVTHKFEYDDQDILTDTTRDSVSDDYEHKTVDEFERGMNLGIMATQDLVKNEVQLRMEADFRTMVYRDIANYVFYMS